jgi:hypothetical protein
MPKQSSQLSCADEVIEQPFDAAQTDSLGEARFGSKALFPGPTPCPLTPRTDIAPRSRMVPNGKVSRVTPLAGDESFTASCLRTDGRTARRSRHRACQGFSLPKAPDFCSFDSRERHGGTLNKVGSKRMRECSPVLTFHLQMCSAVVVQFEFDPLNARLIRR